MFKKVSSDTFRYRMKTIYGENIFLVFYRCEYMYNKLHKRSFWSEYD